MWSEEQNLKVRMNQETHELLEDRVDVALEVMMAGITSHSL